MEKLVKIILGLVLMMAVGCEYAEDVVMRQVTIYADDTIEGSRTSFDYDEQSNEFSTSWVEGDKMQVLIDTGDANATSYQFELKDVESGKFACDAVADITTDVDAYGVYPSSATLSTVDYTATLQIGAKLQSQAGQAPNHVAEYDPLYGSQEGVGLDNIRLQMHHTAAVMQFSIKNETGAEVGIKSVKIYAPTVIAGGHTLDLKTETLTATEDVSKTIELTFSEVSLADDATAKAWVAMAPFTVAADEELVFVVTTTDDKKYSYTKSFSASVEFPAGKVMEMSAPIVLSEASVADTVIVDLTGGSSSYPSDFPTTKATVSGSEPIQYTLCGQSFKLYTTQYYWCGSKGEKLRFGFNGANNSTKPSANDYALLYLPTQEGKKLFHVEVVLDDGIDSNMFKIAVANPDNLAASHDGSNNAQDSSFELEEMVNEMNVDVSKQCCVYIHFNGATNVQSNNCNCYITAINITYIPE